MTSLFNLFRVSVPICAAVAVMGIVRPEWMTAGAKTLTRTAFQSLDWFFMLSANLDAVSRIFQRYILKVIHNQFVCFYGCHLFAVHIGGNRDKPFSVNVIKRTQPL